MKILKNNKDFQKFIKRYPPRYSLPDDSPSTYPCIIIEQIEHSELGNDFVDFQFVYPHQARKLLNAEELIEDGK